MILGVNIDHIATIREARKGAEPDPTMAATLAILGGADGITVHLREDRRHIKDRDLRLLREMVTVELNLEMAATGEMIRTALSVKPDMVTIVPEKRQELTTEGGLDIATARESVSEAIKTIQGAGIPVSLFINPQLLDIDLAKNVGAEMVEIHTGYYANARGEKRRAELLKIADSLKTAHESGLEVNVGHGLTYVNVNDIVRFKELRGLYIGHSIISRAVFVGMERAVRDMKELLRSADMIRP